MIYMKKKIILLLILLILPFGVEAKSLADMRKELKKLEAKLAESKNQEKLNKEEVEKINSEINTITNTAVQQILLNKNSTKNILDDLQKRINVLGE